MSTLFAFQTAFEILMAGFIIWGIFNEGVLVKFEEKIVAFFRRKKMRVVKNSVSGNRHCA